MSSSVRLGAALSSAAAVLLAAAAPSGCAGQPGSAPRSPPSWHYDIAIDDSLTRIDVTLTLHGRLPDRIELGNASGLVGLTTPMDVRTGRALARADDGFAIIAGIDAVRYVVDLGALERTEVTDLGVRRIGRAVVVPPAVWLLRPDVIAPGARADLAWRLPAGCSVSVPWRHAGDGYVLDRSAFVVSSRVVIGRLLHLRVPDSGAEIDVSVLDGPRAATDEDLSSWLRTSWRSVTTLAGDAPARRCQMVIEPKPQGAKPGDNETFHGGGPGVWLAIGPSDGPTELARAGTATHELIHVATPPIAMEDSWLSEGLATYFTELALSRSGLLPPAEAWSHLVAGFERGRVNDEGRSIADSSEGPWDADCATQRTYWGGAAVALLLDVTLRQDSGGRRSLDDAMRELHRWDGGDRLVLSADAALAHLDAWYGRPVFRATARAIVGASEFPDVGTTLARLGVRQDGTLDDTAPWAAIRRVMER